MIKKVLLLLSDGIDSPVAGHLLKNAGLEVIAVYFDNQPFNKPTISEKVKQLAKIIKIKKLYIIPDAQMQIEVIKNCTQKYTCLLFRRMMYTIAEEIAKKEGCDALATGENLAQVASQTLSNLVAEEKAVTIPILRPLLCFDKRETIAIAQQIKTYEISILEKSCCSAVPTNPATNSTAELLAEEETKFDRNNVIKDSIEKATIIEP